jgi:hypothetical protein
VATEARATALQARKWRTGTQPRTAASPLPLTEPIARQAGRDRWQLPKVSDSGGASSPRRALLAGSRWHWRLARAGLFVATKSYTRTANRETEHCVLDPARVRRRQSHCYQNKTRCFTLLPMVYTGRAGPASSPPERGLWLVHESRKVLSIFAMVAPFQLATI